MQQLVWAVATQVLLFVVLLVAATTEVLYRKVYNWLTYPAIAFGLTIASCTGELSAHAIGFLLGAGLFGLFAFMGGMGGGDWKLIAAIGAMKGWQFLIYAMFYSSFLGAALAIGLLAYHGRLLEGIRRSARHFFGLKNPELLANDPINERIPYGVAIAFGTLIAFMLARPEEGGIA